MKKTFLAILVIWLFILSLSGCQRSETSKPVTTVVPSSIQTTDPTYTPSLTTQFTAEDSIVDGFVHYQSKNQSPDFSIIFPANWEYGWNTGSRLWVFEISLGDLIMSTALNDLNTTLFINRYSPSIPDTKHLTGAQLADEPQIKHWTDTAKSVIEYPAPTTINGQEATKLVFIKDNHLETVVLITDGSLVLQIWSSTPVENQEEFLPIVENIINSIEIIPNLH